VTAAGQGIGRAIAEAFAAEGASVIATDVDESKLDGIRSAKRLKLDARSTASVEAVANQVAAEFGALDVLVNCAGYVHHGSVLDCSEQDWDFSFDLNVKSMHRTIRAFLPGMLEKKAGSIVNISSAVSSIRGVPDRYAYGATKAAVIGLTKAVAADFVRQGIRANAICPGTIDSPSLEGRIREALADDGEDRRRGGARLHRAPAHGPPGQARGGRGARRLSRLRRGQLHHRAAASGGRRHGAVTTARLIIGRSRPIWAYIVPGHRRLPMRTAMAAAKPIVSSRNHR
jgi:2-keto-3-deoxy-L-fuconate dehydrogenase